MAIATSLGLSPKESSPCFVMPGTVLLQKLQLLSPARATGIRPPESSDEGKENSLRQTVRDAGAGDSVGKHEDGGLICTVVSISKDRR